MVCVLSQRFEPWGLCLLNFFVIIIIIIIIIILMGAFPSIFTDQLQSAAWLKALKPAASGHTT